MRSFAILLRSFSVLAVMLSPAGAESVWIVTASTGCRGNQQGRGHVNCGKKSYPARRYFALFRTVGRGLA
jgi:hypothetical protein